MRCVVGCEEILEILEAMKHLLQLENFVFVIAMDARVLRLAVGQHYAFMGEKLREREEMGRLYLEKLIQIPFSLPIVGGEKLRSMNRSLPSAAL